MNKLEFYVVLTTQVCRRAAYEYDLKSKKELSEQIVREIPIGLGVYSHQFLKDLHDSRDTAGTCLKLDEVCKDTDHIWDGVRMRATSKRVNDSVKRSEMLLEYFNKVIGWAPNNSKNWIDLHHCLNYVYRNFASASPSTNYECLSSLFLDEMRDFILSLIKEDEAQFFLRLLAALREACDRALWNFIEQKDHRITRLVQYYRAIISASKQINHVLWEFTGCMYNHYCNDWIDFNEYLFIRYFWCQTFVQTKIENALRVRWFV
ncbi:unnamed protein product [Diabrotica balteata]|uniref:Uncharacterized protein n=1 Tax=Diabrotica balteata TaxID=107213 RepID=A0A9N9XAV8_DIABA|nr:unnamed protein product [Diabrotica balteata]